MQQIWESFGNNSREDKVHYENLAKSVNEQKVRRSPSKSKKEIKYMENCSTWQSTFTNGVLGCITKLSKS